MACRAELFPARIRNALAGLLLLALASPPGIAGAGAGEADAVASAPAAMAPALAAGTVPRLDEREAVRAGQAAIGRTVGDYTLLDTDGRPVRLASFRGKPLLVSFVYTGCFEACPLVTRTLREAVDGIERLARPDRFNIVSIGFNQPFDSPQAMRAFAAQHRIGQRNWHVLSPPAAIVDAVTRDFGFRFVATPAGFDHVLGVTVLDAEGRVHAQVYADRITAEKLGEPLRALLTGEPPPGGAARLADFVERVRILCTVYDAQTGQYRTNYALLWEIAGGLAFFLSAAAYLGAEWRRQRRARRIAPAPAAASGRP